MPEEFEFTFLEEKPLEKSEEFLNAKFGHEEISSALCKTIARCPTPFTIGLFGRWGAGKSTIANSVKEKLLPKKIAVVLFDVWKHEGDALRRTFLKEAVGQLKNLGEDYFDISFKVDERLEQSVSRSSEGKFVINRGKLKQLFWICGIATLLLCIGWAIAFSLGLGSQYLALLRSASGPLLGITGGGALVVLLLKNGVELFSAETVTYGTDKLQDPHEFEAEFGRILSGLKNNRLLVIFDNLDRTTHDKALEVLTTVKTFLEPKDIENSKKEVVFLVPCDARAIKSHVANVYKSDGGKITFNPDEFLRKFFNSIIWIPDFIPSELENFARTNLKNTKVKDLEDNLVAWIITKAFRENPRQIVQFINILLANYLLVKEREEKGDFIKDFAKNNIAQLTKYLILSELFPDEMENLRDSKVLDLEDVRLNELKTEDKESKEAFIRFLSETSQDIPISNLRIFFTLRRSEQEKGFPGVESFISMLEDKKVDEATQYFEKLGDFSNSQVRENFSQVVKTELEDKINPVSAVSLVDTLLVILDGKGIQLTDTAYGEISNKLNNLCLKSLHSIKPAVLDRQLLNRFPRYRGTVVGQWVEVMERHLEGNANYQVSDTFIKDVVQVFAEHPDYLDINLMTRIKKILSERLAANMDIAEVLLKDSARQKQYITPQYLQAAFIGIPKGGDPIKNISPRLKILTRVDAEVMKSMGGAFMTTQLSEIQNAENQQTTPERFLLKENLAADMNALIGAHKETFLTTNQQTGDVFASYLITATDGIPDQNNRKIILPLLLRVREVVSDAKKAEINARIQPFCAQATSESIDYLLERIDYPEALLEQEQYGTILARSLSDQNFFNYFYDKVSKIKQEEMLDRLFDQDSNRAIQFAEAEGYKIPNPVAFSQRVLAKIDTLPAPDDKKHMLDVVITLKANDAGIRDSFADKLQTLLTSTDSQLQIVGHSSLTAADKLLSKDRKRALVKHVLDWLKRPDLPTKYQPAAIKTVYALRDQFNEEEEKEFLQFIFEELIRKASSAEQVDLGFSLLQGIAPKYEERKENFDDVKTRVGGEPDEKIKQALVKGLKSISSVSTNQHNKEYWEWVSSLS